MANPYFCIRHAMITQRNTSWCDKPIEEGQEVFSSVDHALYKTLEANKRIICPQCLEKIKAVMRIGSLIW